MQLSAEDLGLYYRPVVCELRVHLRHAGLEAAPSGPYEQVLGRLGARHLNSHLASLPEFVNLAVYPTEERKRHSVRHLRRRTPVLYQPLLHATASLGGTECRIQAAPDFMLATSEGHVLRDVRLARHAAEDKHPEIARRLQLCGWLYERLGGRPPARLEVFCGTGGIEEVPYDGGMAALEALKAVVRIRQAPVEPYSPVGWSKCLSCGYQEYCWSRARKKNDAAVLVGVDKNLATALRAAGVETVAQLLERFDEATLAEFKKPWGQREQRVGKSAAAILRMAHAWHDRREIYIQRPELPEFQNFVMFDLEGLPPQLDELQKIYLWGLQVFGEDPGPFEPAVAGFGEAGDRQGWLDFLARAQAIFGRYGDLPFVHWAVYEKTNIKMYQERYGDPDGIAARVLDNLLDLLPVTQRSIALPLQSYGLKVIEKYIGFKRTMREYGGDWSIAKYIEAMETEDEARRTAILDEILLYNEEDLQATWAVFQWLKMKNRAFIPAARSDSPTAPGP